MSNPKYDPQKDHTREKLRIFAAYLDRCLSIMRHHFSTIGVYDMFAGQGKYGDDEGSAMLAANIIGEHRKAGCDIRLYLNDSDPETCRKLQANIRRENNRDWVFCTQKDANEAIASYIDFPLSSQLFYLDPFGYSQIRKNIMDAICFAPKTECLLFVPVSHIARFARADKKDERFAPLIRFLREYGIDAKDHKNAKLKEWRRIIKDAFVHAYPDRFVGMAELTPAGPNYYGLYFIGNHILGLEKFLEVVHWIKKEKGIQLNMFSADESEIRDYLSEERTNSQLCEWMFRHGHAPKPGREILKRMEERGEILVRPISGKRRKGTFYLSAKHNNLTPKIMIQSAHVGN